MMSYKTTVCTKHLSILVIDSGYALGSLPLLPACLSDLLLALLIIVPLEGSDSLTALNNLTVNCYEMIYEGAIDDARWRLLTLMSEMLRPSTRQWLDRQCLNQPRNSGAIRSTFLSRNIYIYICMAFVFLQVMICLIISQNDSRSWHFSVIKA